MIIKSIQCAIIDMKKAVVFDEKEHKYIRRSDGKWLAGVSSVADIMPKPYLQGWAAKMVVEFLQDKQEIIKQISAEEYQNLLYEAKNNHRRKSNEALDLGSIGHLFLSKYVLARIRNTKLPKMPMEMSRPLNKAIDWLNENIKDFILSEAIVADTKEEFAGTLDAMAITKEGKLTIIDFKFSNQIGPSYHLQTAGYSIPFGKYGIEVEDRIIIRLPKTLTKNIYNKQLRQYDEVENDIEISRSPFSMDFDKKAFLCARELYRYINATN